MAQYCSQDSRGMLTCALVNDLEQIMSVLIWTIAIDAEGDERTNTNVQPESSALSTRSCVNFGSNSASEFIYSKPIDHLTGE